MPDLNFEVEGVEPQRFAASPHLLFKLRVTEKHAPGAAPTLVHSITLRCQIRIEPAKRRYEASERERLLDLFGSPERWGQTLRPMLWTHVIAVVPGFEGSGTAELLVPCTFDFNVSATKYFGALDDGEIPLSFLFSGTIFHDSDGAGLQVAQISWEKEATFRLPASVWHEMMELYYPNSAWLCLRKDVFDRLDRYRSRGGHPTWEHAIERLLENAAEPVSP